MPLKKVDKFHIASLLNRLAKKYSEPVVARVRVMMHAIFEEAVDMDFIGKNPARKIPLPECRASRRPVLAPEALRKLFAAVVDPCDRLLLLVATFCAMRTSEVLGLTWGSYQGDSLLIQNIAWEGKTLRGKDQDQKSRAPVYLPLELRREIEAWKILSDPQACSGGRTFLYQSSQSVRQASPLPLFQSSFLAGIRDFSWLIHNPVMSISIFPLPLNWLLVAGPEWKGFSTRYKAKVLFAPPLCIKKSFQSSSQPQCVLSGSREDKIDSDGHAMKSHSPT
jgi:integrase